MLKKGAPVREPEVSAVRIGEAVRVTLRVTTAGERYLVVEDPIPAGFEVVPGTLSGPFAEAMRYDDRMVFFLENPKPEVALSYLVQGEAPGRVRTPPAVTYAMYRPNAAAWSGEDALAVADFGEKLDRDETLAWGAADLWSEVLRTKQAGESKQAQELLATLLDRYELNEKYLTLALRTLARIHAGAGDHAGTVGAYDRLLAEVPSFRPEIDDEVLLAKANEALSRFGDAMGSLERIAWHLFRIDQQVPPAIGGPQATTIEADLLDRYPAGEYTEREFLRRADRGALAYEEALAKGRPADERLLADLTEFLARYPESPAAPRVAFRHARTRLRAGKFTELEELSRRFGDRYPDSALRDDADWFTAYALFAQGRLPEAEQFTLAALAREYTREDGGKGPSDYRKNLVHLLAQVAHIEGRLDEAVALYEQVKDFTVDAREALKQLTEVTFAPPAVVRAGLGESVSIEVTCKNLGPVDYRVYPVDLLVYFTLKKDVEKVAGLNLDGLPPKQQGTLSRPAGTPRLGYVSEAGLGRLDPGVYLVIFESGGREKRTLVIVSDLAAEIRKHRDGVRILVTHRESGRPVAGAFVKLAQDGRLLKEGRTDPRGVFEVRGEFGGRLSAVVEKDGAYALTKR
jgi:tetratricopeptide (TPR) repeat protein